MRESCRSHSHFLLFFSEDARSLLRGLLERNPKKRLGGGSGDVEEIKKHPFFKSIDWTKLENKEIEPPFRPYLINELDVRFFDPESTAEVARHSFITRPGLDNDEQDPFQGFSYVAPEEVLRTIQRRRTSSGSRHLPRRMSRSGSNASPIYVGSPIPNSSSENSTPTTKPPDSPILSTHRNGLRMDQLSLSDSDSEAKTASPKNSSPRNEAVFSMRSSADIDNGKPK